jgi:hypothetical protein
MSATSPLSCLSVTGASPAACRTLQGQAVFFAGASGVTHEALGEGWDVVAEGRLRESRVDGLRLHRPT